MKLTNYKHACFSLEIQGKMVIVDPGGWTTDLGTPENVVAIIVTHEHQDHFDPNTLGAIVAHNPDAVIYGHKSITNQLGDNLPNQAVTAGEIVQSGPFSFEFFGGEHAIIHSDMPASKNLGVMINGALYHPGDSFTLPNKPVSWLALPVAAPWLKSSESIDFARAIDAKHVFPNHDAILSESGKQLIDQICVNLIGHSYKRQLDPIEING